MGGRIYPVAGNRLPASANSSIRKQRGNPMTKYKFLISPAISALLVSGALAQSPNSSSGPSPTAGTSSPAAQAQPSSGMADFVTSQKPDQWLASKFRGTNLLGADNESIGDVSDILFDKDGKIQAYVISVGGFLGMGAKEVALAPSSFDVIPERTERPICSSSP
jgi:hypothetical protein